MKSLSQSWQLIALAIVTLATSAMHTNLTLAAGVGAGGGGSECKLDFMDTYRKLSQAIESKPDLMSKFPFLQTTLSVLSPSRTPLVELQTQTTPISGCRLAENPLACSKPDEHIIQLNCGSGGWDGLELYSKYKHLLHELLWWQTEVQDNNYFYSDLIIKKLQGLEVPGLNSNSSSQGAFAQIESLWLASEGKPFLFDKMSHPNVYGDHTGFVGDVYETSGEEPTKVSFTFMYYDWDQGIFLPKRRQVTIQPDRSTGLRYYEPTLTDKNSGTVVSLGDQELYEIRQVADNRLVIATIPDANGDCAAFTHFQNLKTLPGKNYCSLTLVIKP